MLILGLMTGTSLDGIDAALIEIEGDSVESISWRLVTAMTMPYTDEQREEIHSAILRGTAEAICLLDARLGEMLAEAAIAVCAAAGVDRENVDEIGRAHV